MAEGFKILSHEDLGEEGKNEFEQKREIAVNAICNDLSQDLAKNNVRERKYSISEIFQQYGTDCGIACTRMVLVYYGFSDLGTNGLVARAQKIGLDFPTINDIDGNSGPTDDFNVTCELLKKEFNIEQESRPPLTPEPLIEALKSGQPVRLSINFPTLHPEDLRERSHAILIKGYRFNQDNQLVLIANDPKPEVGGEIEITKNQLSDAMKHSYSIYRQIEGDKDSA